VEFQRPSEQYTPWKDSDLEEEEVEPIMGPPTSWAEALRRKTNLANGISEDSPAPKGKQFQVTAWQITKRLCSGPAKPKLVARVPGSDQSPWKIRKDAPKILGKDVPGTLRPLMSCALWRLHEHIDRNDINELFLLSDQTEIRTVAEKLNITVRSTQELKQLLASKIETIDLATFGDLEREFGVQRKTSESPSLNGVASVHPDAEASQQPRNGSTISEEKTDRPTLVGENGRVNGSQLLHEEAQRQADTRREEILANGLEVAQISPAIGVGDGKTTVEEPLVESTVTIFEATAPPKLAWSAVLKAGSHGAKRALEDGENVNGFMTNKSHNTIPQDSPTQQQQRNMNSESRSSPTTSPPPQVDATKPVQSTENEKIDAPAISSLPMAAMSTPLIRNHTADEPEDSDEEVVVFKPSAKRYSTQKKPTQQNSSPSTPITPFQQNTSTPVIQPQQKPMNESPKPAVLKPHPQPRPGSSHGRNPMLISHGHPQPKSSPTVIDPDAFGRSFAVNTNAGPHNLHNPRSHHYPKPPTQKGPPTQVSRSPRRSHARNNSSHQTLRDDSQRLSPAPEAKPELSPRVSPRRRSRGFDSGNGAQKAFDPTPGAGRRPTTPGSKTAEADDFVSRSAFSEAQFKPQALQAMPFEAPELIPRLQMTEAQPKAVLPTPKAFETTDDFVPRSAISQELYKPRVSEPDFIEPRASMPDVQYVLKSGSTRASARGRGRLWTPS